MASQELLQQHGPRESMDYDVVVVGSSIHVGKHDKSVIAWIGANRAALDARQCKGIVRIVD